MMLITVTRDRKMNVILFFGFKVSVNETHSKAMAVKSGLLPIYFYKFKYWEKSM